jgi:glycosyltransferase involved in cell wall biosynthesis
MIYCLFNSTSSYQLAHSCTFKGVGLAKGFIAAGADACVLWGGKTRELHGVPHVHCFDARPTKKDTLIYYGNILGHRFLTSNLYAHLHRAGTRVWYPCSIKSYNGHFWDAVVIENESFVEKVQPHSSAKIIGCLFGCPHDIDTGPPNPYGPGKHLFFAGRLMEKGPQNQLATMRRLIDLLPEDYHIWIASTCLWVRLPGRAGVNVYSPAGYIGRNGDPAHHTGGMLLRNVDFTRMGNRALDHDRMHFLGPLTYGTFFDRIEHARCVLDFGYQAYSAGPNSKIMEALRYGTPVVADGLSQSFELINKYGCGRVVPYRDLSAMAEAIVSWPEETAEVRRRRGLSVRDGESWHQRSKYLLERLEGVTRAKFNRRAKNVADRSA